MRRFKEEAVLLGKINHPNIVQVYDFHEENGTGYIVMEYLEGKSLEEELESGKRMGEGEIQSLLLPILEGLEQVQEMQILHRDIKPQNIMLTKRGAILIDFGASRQYALGQSKSMTQVLTPGYAPLEQYGSRAVFGPPLDIYAVGATMYRMLEGKRPPDAVDLAMQNVELGLGGNGRIETIIRRCMEPKVPDRYPNVEELRAALTGKSQPVKAGKTWATPAGMVLVEKGSFQMGNTRDDPEGRDDEKPVHTVNFTYDFWIGQYEVTFDDYDAYCAMTGETKPDDEGWGRGARPVINVTWRDAIRYCNWLSEIEGLAKAYDSAGNLLDRSGKVTTDITQVEGYRLPTEAEWEYAARGGQNSRGYKYAGSDDLNKVGWYWENSGRKTHPVGEKIPNELGLYDMSGNVWEWCHDWFVYYSKEPQTNPIGPSCGASRVDRGGSWYNYEQSCRAAVRHYDAPTGSNYYGLGFRLSRTVF